MALHFGAFLVVLFIDQRKHFIVEEPITRTFCLLCGPQSLEGD
jgi:hypothetical protein